MFAATLFVTGDPCQRHAHVCCITVRYSMRWLGLNPDRGSATCQNVHLAPLRGCGNILR